MGVATTTELGMVTSSRRSVLIFVDRLPRWATVPSISPILTKSPSRTAREYVKVKPLIAWPTMPLEPSEMTRPMNTLTPLNASDSLPGKYG